MMTLNEALARNRLFWATFIKIYGSYPTPSFGTKKIELFWKIFPHHLGHGWPSCFACYYNLERPFKDHCNERCIIPWTGLGGCTNLESPYWNHDAIGILKCIDKAIKKYDDSVRERDNLRMIKRLSKELNIIIKRRHE